MGIAIIGTGAIAAHVAAAIGTPDALIVRSGTRRHDMPDCPALRSVAELPRGVDLVVDCAGHSGLAAHGADVLAAGIDVLTVSLGALADDALAGELTQAARAGGAVLHLATGAIGALDVLRAARTGALDEVAYTGRKPPAGWAGSPAEGKLDLTALDGPATHFEGSARDAARDYPKNANVAAAAALAGLGFDATKVTLIADPGVGANVHEIAARGDFGEMSFRVAGRALPDNPRSSALAAMSVVAALRERRAQVRFG